jgi:hypothetical protein
VKGKLRGDVITFVAGDDEYAGRVTGDVMEGTVKSGAATTRWRATRKTGH